MISLTNIARLLFIAFTSLALLTGCLRYDNVQVDFLYSGEPTNIRPLTIQVDYFDTNNRFHTAFYTVGVKPGDSFGQGIIRTSNNLPDDIDEIAEVRIGRPILGGCAGQFLNDPVEDPAGSKNWVISGEAIVICPN